MAAKKKKNIEDSFTGDVSEYFFYANDQLAHALIVKATCFFEMGCHLKKMTKKQIVGS